MFLAQALSADGSCRQAVNDAAVQRLIAGLTPHISSTSAYCQARSKLLLSMIESLTRHTPGESSRKARRRGGSGATAGYAWSMGRR